MTNLFPDVSPELLPEAFSALLVKFVDAREGLPAPRYIWLRALYAARESWVEIRSLIVKVLVTVRSRSL